MASGSSNHLWKRLFIYVVFPLLALGADYAHAEDRNTEDRNNEVSFEIGHRTDNLRWDIAGISPITSNPVNVLSELKWQDLQIIQARVKAKGYVARPVYLKGSLGYGAIYSGSNQDSDFNGNDRTLEFSRSNNNAGSGSVLDLSAAAGYRNDYLVTSSGSGIMPVIGYSYHRQNLRLTDGVQTIPATGPFPGLESTYEAVWHGPWVGADLAYKRASLALLGSLEYHFLNAYNADANWNLRTDLAHPVSFRHEATGYGIVASAGLNYSINERLSVIGTFDIQRWTTDPGTDTTFFPDGTSSPTRLNEVVWNSYDLMLGIKYVFSSF
jgi:outer membrane protein Pom